MASPVIQMVQDPDFARASPAEQQKALVAHDPMFARAGAGDIAQFVQAHQKPAALDPARFSSMPGAPLSRGDLAKSIDSGEGPIAQGLTTFESKFSQLPGQMGSALKRSWMEKQGSDEKAGTSADSFVDPRRWNPIATGEGNLAMNIGATAANLAPLAIDPAGGGIMESPLGSLLKAGAKVPAEVSGRASIQRAGQGFQDVMGAARNIPVDVSTSGNTALQIQKLAESGGSMPKVVRDFVKRTTDPSKAPLTYEEARDFYSNASRLSADETMRLTPVMKRMVGQFRSDLGDAIAGAAGQAGKADVYQGAMKGYRQGMQRQETVQDLTDMLKQGAVKALGGGLAGYGATRAYEALTKKK